MSELNGVMMQYFHWYYSSDGSLWKQVEEKAEDLRNAGVTSLYLPPACKGAAGGYDVGYGVYDLFDLGEFDQKGSIRTKYGTKQEYINAIKKAQSLGIRVYADLVFNHKLGADEEEEMEATPFNPDNRNDTVGEYQTIKAWTGFTFPGRGEKYSSMKWHWWHFDAIDYNSYNADENAIYLFKGKEFDRNVNLEKGNFDYLMGCDLDMSHPEVVGELKYWGEWYINTTNVDGFRFDAVKHVSADFFREWLEHISKHAERDIFAVGEYWSYDVEALNSFIETTNGRVTLFDTPLHQNFHIASNMGNDYDMRQIFDNTLVQHQPTLAVTFVENHDSQPLQALESVVESWFKPLAYGLILLRKDGYPCIFYADYYGADYKDIGNDGEEHEIWIDSLKFLIDKMLFARKTFAYGDQYNYFDHPNTIGWTRLGNDEKPGGMAIVLSNGDAGSKYMEVGQPNRTYIDITEHSDKSIETNEEGWAEFRCEAGSISVWVPN
ncbi:cytochrome C oxidase subunit II [Neosynechococcus sphagnicola sy1]|uniref:Cytochrome C oxidase subunit II n=1 Tax=Neosynechococcus sphagnicola sy1 TaxID=1497020 RepID=A0A098TMX8_9CYAN|nr:alpha-amylase [Neosynechococcus sphagnicola]KGF72203.1 cytochrome C oxidase subunit II [Neosynechococcus sphagnicola sy1]